MFTGPEAGERKLQQVVGRIRWTFSVLDRVGLGHLDHGGEGVGALGLRLVAEVGGEALSHFAALLSEKVEHGQRVAQASVLDGADGGPDGVEVLVEHVFSGTCQIVGCAHAGHAILSVQDWES